MLPQPYIIRRHIIRITFFERIAIALQPRISHSRVTSPTQFRLRFRRFVTSPQCASGLRFGLRCFDSTVDPQHVLGFRLSFVPLTSLRLSFRFSSFDFVAALQCTCGLRFGFRSLDPVAELRCVFGLLFRHWAGSTSSASDSASYLRCHPRFVVHLLPPIRPLFIRFRTCRQSTVCYGFLAVSVLWVLIVDLSFACVFGFNFDLWISLSTRRCDSASVCDPFDKQLWGSHTVTRISSDDQLLGSCSATAPLFQPTAVL
jgi:hypothetical protein